MINIISKSWKMISQILNNQKMSLEMRSLKMVFMVFQIHTRSDNRIEKWSPKHSKVKLKFWTSISNWKVNQKMSLEMWSLKMVIMVFQMLLLKTQLLSDISEKSITFGIV